MFYFLGDSFTWGQGLYFEKWIEEKTKFGNIKDIKKFKCTSIRHECLSFEDNQFRIQNSFPHLVSKHYNMNYFVPKFTNGGTNYDIIHQLRTQVNTFNKEVISHVFIQLTDFWRPMEFHLQEPFTEEERKGLYIDGYGKNGRDIKIFDELIDTQINALKTFFEENSTCKFYVLSWHNDIAERFISKLGDDEFVKIHYGGRVYDSFDWILNKVSLQSKYGIFDDHFTTEGHQVIADSIIKKLGDIEHEELNEYAYLKRISYYNKNNII